MSKRLNQTNEQTKERRNERTNEWMNGTERLINSLYQWNDLATKLNNKSNCKKKKLYIYIFFSERHTHTDNKLKTTETITLKNTRKFDHEKVNASWRKYGKCHRIFLTRDNDK